MSTLRAGGLKHRITIQRKTSGMEDEYNQPLPEAWESLTPSPIWANVRHQSGSEATKADASVSTVKASIRIRWRIGIDAGMRVLYAGAVYDIEAVLPGGNRQHVDLVCKRVN